MKALIYKEIAGQEYRYVLLYYLILSIIFSNSIEYAVFTLAPTLLTIAAMMSIIMGDIVTKNNVFICSLPITRKEFVISRYVSVILFNTIFCMFSLVIGLVLHLIGIIQIGTSSINLVLSSYIMVLGFAGIILPLYPLIKNTKIIALISLSIFLIIVVGRSILETILNVLYKNMLIKNMFESVLESDYSMMLFFVFMIVFFTTSLLLAIKLYEKRDLL